jgi:hypothetical protein
MPHLLSNKLHAHAVFEPGPPWQAVHIPSSGGYRRNRLGDTAQVPRLAATLFSKWLVLFSKRPCYSPNDGFIQRDAMLSSMRRYTTS